MRTNADIRRESSQSANTKNSTRSPREREDVLPIDTRTSAPSRDSSSPLAAGPADMPSTPRRCGLTAGPTGCLVSDAN